MRIGPAERIEDGNDLLFSGQVAALPQGGADLSGDGLDLGPGGRDEEGGFAALAGLQIGRRGLLVERGGLAMLHDLPGIHEPLKCLSGPPLRGERDDGFKLGGPLSPNLGQGPEPIAGMLLDDAQGVAPGDGGVLAGVAD